MIGQTVTYSDLQPNGWICENCGYLFTVGDIAYPVTWHLLNGELVESYWVCERCNERMA